LLSLERAAEELHSFEHGNGLHRACKGYGVGRWPMAARAALMAFGRKASGCRDCASKSWNDDRLRRVMPVRDDGDFLCRTRCNTRWNAIAMCNGGGNNCCKELLPRRSMPPAPLKHLRRLVSAQAWSRALRVTCIDWRSPQRVSHSHLSTAPAVHHFGATLGVHNRIIPRRHDFSVGALIRIKLLNEE
jgi:hypothetical protein